ncbi:hypothetical protein CASFOL_036113 [Castilleja foliolosa]|uniref:Cytochrome P450 n=1 Tax=Castilleja foliolosa TaxID=1961234 RepID=A0ABD3BUN4_9LAMI
MSSQTQELPARKIPGSYGLPFFGPIRDRYNYYYSQGEAQFFKSRIEKYQSTVFRCNMPPGPFIARNSRVVCLLDALSFRTLFDNSKVDKTDVLDGTFMPSLSFTGGYRACAYLDPSEPNHAALKGFFLTFLAEKHNTFIPLFRQVVSGLFSGLEDKVSSKGSSNFNDLSDAMSFEYVFWLFCDKSPLETSIGPKGPKIVDLWLGLQLAPLTTSGSRFIPRFLDDLLLHTFPMSFFIVKSGYKKLYNAFFDSAKLLLDEGEKLGFKRDEICHNLVFLAGFNAYGGMKALFPSLIKWVATSGQDLHRRLANEIRAVAKENGGVNLGAIDQMALTKSVVYEALRIEPPVPYQYGKAKQDFEIQNHESSFSIKKGEMLFGYQPIVTQDPKIFEKPNEFIPDRFVGEGERLLEYVYWSNGPETESPTTGNKQCPGKDMIVILCRLMLVEFFLKYDTFDVEIGKLPFGSSVTFKSLTKATN